ncbi:MAG: helix-turn-helix domain-containing protein [Candidatus Tumulicola sp.]
MQQQEAFSFGTLLKRLRVGAGLSQEQLAERARISAQAVGAYERGIRRAPHRDTLALLIEALDVRGEACDELTAAAEHARGRRPGAAARGAGGDEARTNLPPLLSDLVGREDEVARITSLLATHRLVTIVGAGGVGKTRASLQVGEDLLNQFPDGVWFVELAPLTNAELIATTVAAAMGVQLIGQADPLAQLGRALKRLQALLIFDNCEHVIAGVATVAARLLRECPQLAILASSRQPLEIQGEATFRMPSLAPEAAVTLFAERAAAIDDAFALTPENHDVIADICRRVDGIPLAIELAAARVKIFTPQQLARRLDERFQLLAGGRRDVLARQQTLLAAIDWSYQLLEERERTLLRRVAVFASSFTFEGAIAVGKDASIQEFEIVDTLQSLVNKSLVVREARDGEQRFRLLESTRAYAKRLSEPAERDVISRCHLRYFQSIFGSVPAEAPSTVNTTRRDAVFAAELEEVRAALDWAIEHDVCEGARLLAAVGVSWRRAGLHDEGLRRAQGYASLLPGTEHELAANLWSTIAYTSCNTDPDLCMTSAERALEEARASGDGVALSVALTAYAHALIRRGRVAEALDALDAHDQYAGPTHRSRFLRATAWALSGDYDSATMFFSDLRALLLAAGDVTEAAVCAQNQAENEHWRGNTGEAVSLVSQAIDEFHATDDRVSVILCLSNLCGYLVASGRLGEAKEAARQVLLEGHRLYPDIYSMTNALEHLALVFALESDYEVAATLAGYAEAAHEREGYMREHTESTTRTRLEASLRANVPDAQLSALTATGASLSADDAVNLALLGSAGEASLDFA